MKISTAAIASIFLVGCAAPMTWDRALALAHGAQDWELCYFYITGKGDDMLRQAVSGEMRGRNTDCNQHMAMVQAKISADGGNQAQINNALMLLQAARPQPQPQPLPKTTYCRTVWVGGGYNTVCD